ncbi:MAG: hypothetical protein KDE55_21750, partial [Novosphingobium sp.]|nr:hypothetical protein [Novosphingobium sp.]
PYSVLLDFKDGIDNPGVRYLGDKLAAECGASDEIDRLDDIPSRSLLSRITDHYMQILGNQAPIGFEAEFVNQRGSTILYRGILLPFSSDGETIDYIYGVINWKELADQKTTDELLLEIEQVLETKPQRDEAPLTEWADGPADMSGVLDLRTHGEPVSDETGWPEPAFGSPLASDETAMELADWLASARELAQAAKGSEDRTRQALYAAIGRAYDFSVAAAQAPEDYRELVEDSGLTMQERAPMTPLVKLVFGADYDKTRIAEYATAISHAHRLHLARGAFADHLAKADGGLKGIVATERRMRREESGKLPKPANGPDATLATKLRQLEPVALADLAHEGEEFALLVARRLPSGEVVLLGEVPSDNAMLEKAARKLVA